MSSDTALLNGGMNVKKMNGVPSHNTTQGNKSHEKTEDNGCCGCTCLKKISNVIVSGLERSFYRLVYQLSIFNRTYLDFCYFK